MTNLFQVHLQLQWTRKYNTIKIKARQEPRASKTEKVQQPQREVLLRKTLLIKKGDYQNHLQLDQMITSNRHQE